MPPKRARHDDHAYRAPRQPLPGLGAPILRRSRRNQGLPPHAPPVPAAHQPPPHPMPVPAPPAPPMPIGLPPQILAAQQIAANNNMRSFLYLLPANVRNMIYELLMDQFDSAHSVRNLMRAPFGIYDPTVAPGQARLMGALYPLVLTPGSDHTAANPAYQPTNPLHTAPSLARDYTRMKRDLLAFGQVSRLCRAEYRAWQAIKLSAFVRVEELDWYMRIFFPIVNPNDPRSSQYHWNAPEIVFPWWKSGVHDVTPIFDHFRRNYRNPPAVIPGQAPRLAAPVVWSPAHVFINGSVQHDYKIREILFKENHLPGPGWFNTLMSYVTTPGTAYRIAKIEMRSHGHPHTRHFARLDIWFEARPGLAWVNGRNWRWPNYTLPDPVLNVGMTRSQRRTWEIRQFIRDTGLSDPEIMGFWEVRLGVLGRHAIGGLGV